METAMEYITIEDIKKEFEACSENSYRESIKRFPTGFCDLNSSQKLKWIVFAPCTGKIDHAQGFAIPVYYRIKYPGLRFVTEKQLNDICVKYGLLYRVNEKDSSISIEEIKVDAKDDCIECEAYHKEVEARSEGYGIVSEVVARMRIDLYIKYRDSIFVVVGRFTGIVHIAFRWCFDGILFEI
ncbi:MAG: hypothetical protein LBL13_03355 [Bacteroidales bacterium]|nr:hypothetical protein [Bacteroidales bacterium]